MAEEVEITGRCTEKVMNLSIPSLSFNEDNQILTIKTSWKIPSDLTAKTNPRRAENFCSWVGLWCSAPQLSNTENFERRPGDYHYCIDAMYGANLSSYENTINLSRFYPYSLDGPKVKRFYCYVSNWNWRGDLTWDEKAYVNLPLVKPDALEISEPEFDDETGHVSCELERGRTSNAKHVRSMYFRRACYDSMTGNWAGVREVKNSTAESVTDDVDLSGVGTIQGDRYWRYRIYGHAMGLAGDSKVVERNLYVSQPKTPTIKVSAAGINANSRVSVSVNANATTEHPVTGMRLQVLRSSPYTTAADAVADLRGIGWENLDSVDDGQCVNLTTFVSEVRPDPDTYTWIRVMTWNLSETKPILQNWSVPVRLKALEGTAASAKNDKCGIISITPAKNGLTASVRIGWTEDLANTGTELSWADNPNAWSATDSPSTATFEDANFPPSSSSGTGWTKERTVTLSGLAPGTTYWVRARRYLEGTGSTTTYTAYCKAWSFKAQGAENDSCGIVSCKPGKDGTTATVIVGFTEDSDNTGTELTWSADENAWWSNVQPDTLTATWVDSPRQSSDWQKTATIYLRGLEPSTTYYIRARRYLESGGTTTYTPMSKVGSFTTPADSIDEAANDNIGIVSIEAGDDGTSADLVIGWTETTSYDGTEVTWSDREDAWESTEQPSSFQATWADTKSRSSDWKTTQLVHVEELEQGTKYWFRVRRYGSEGSSGWSNVVSIIPAVQPDSVTLMSPAFVERGKAVELTWSYGGGSEQTSWRVMSGGKVVASGDDPVTGCVVDATRLRELTKDTDSITLSVEVSTGGDYVASDTVTLGIADRPTIGLTDVEATSQPVSIPVSASSENCYVTMVILAMGASGSSPSGDRVQAAGDTIWSGVIRPDWTGSGPYTDTVTIDSGLDFWDGASYLVTAVATDSVTGLSSDSAYSYIDVDWTHKATTPGEPTIVPYDVTDDKGYRTLGCNVALASPEGYAAGDICDVYRVTADGAVLVAHGVQFGTTINDRYAVLGDAHYRIATRTADGDLDWVDFPYELKCGALLRVDWGGGYVELPYNLSRQDTYEKDFDAVKDLTGAIEGYWNRGVQHRQSLSTDVMRISSQATIGSLRELGRYPGPAFVRTSDGSAYQANVEVSGIDTAYKSAAIAVALNATEVDLTNEFMVNIGGNE